MSRTIEAWHRDLLDLLYSCHKYNDVGERKNRVDTQLDSEANQMQELAREFGVEVARVEQILRKLRDSWRRD